MAFAVVRVSVSRVDFVDYCGGAGGDFFFAAGRRTRVRDNAGALVPSGYVSAGGLYCGLWSGAPCCDRARSRLCGEQSSRRDLLGRHSFTAFVARLERQDSHPGGIYQSRFDLRNAPPASFQFLANSPPDAFTAEAMKLSDVQVYLWFARFPVIHSRAVGDQHVVEFADSRFMEPGQRMPAPFRFRLLFDPNGKLIEEDWAEGTAGLRMKKSHMPASETKPE